MKDILEYLTFLSNYGKEYRTMNLHRSAISVFHKYTDGFTLGKQSRICSLLSGLFI